MTSLYQKEEDRGLSRSKLFDVPRRRYELCNIQLLHSFDPRDTGKELKRY